MTLIGCVAMVRGDREILLPLPYKGLRLNHNYRLDLVLRSGIVRIAN